MKLWKYYHVFADDKDGYYGEKDIHPLLKAMRLWKKWEEAGEQNLRLYYVEEIEDENQNCFEIIREDCIKSKGDFPS